MKRKNNFDFYRLLFSSLVIFSHSYPLTGNREILSTLTNGQLEFGSLSVNAFFVISGYLIANSLKNSPTITNYLWKRLLRLFPAFVVMLIVTLGVVLIVHSDFDILAHKDYFSYLTANLSLYYIQYYIAGIFEANPYPGVLNGSIWSLSYEFTMYLILGLLFVVRKRKVFFLIIIFFLWVGFFYAANFNPMFLRKTLLNIQIDAALLFRLATFFVGGSVLSFFDLTKLNRPILKIVLFLLILLTIYFQVYNLWAYILLPILLLILSISYSKKLMTIRYLV